MMARLGRYFPSDQPLHVIQRGNNRQPIFFDEVDYAWFRIFLAEAAPRLWLRDSCLCVDDQPHPSPDYAEPVRARMSATPADYPWSSYRAHAHGTPDPL